MAVHQDIQTLKQEWLAVSGKWGAGIATQTEVFNNLVKSYTASNRHYHGITHIQHMLRQSRELQHEVQHKNPFYFAIWFHDAIQRSGKDNEYLSAELAAQQLQTLNVPKEDIKQVTTLILATKRHEKQIDSDLALFTDFDLAILAANREIYQKYAKGCQKEYSIPAFLYRQGRKKFLTRLLRRKFIFSSRLFRESKESIARDNINWEITTL